MTHVPHLQDSWTDARTGATCHVVLDRLRYGVASGGVRMRPGCSTEEVAGLAAVMSLKEALLYRPSDAYRPYGGGKGGIDYDPSAPGATEVLHRYVASVRHLLEGCWATGSDLGVRQADLDEAATALGLRSTVDAVLPHVPDGAENGLRRLRRAFSQQVDGLGLGEVVGGYGIAGAATTALRLRGDDPARCTAALQGFGSIGGPAALYLSHAGVRVVAVADAAGTVVNPAGLDVEHLLRSRSRQGLIDRSNLRPGDELRPRSAWLTTPADVLVTAAVSYAVNGHNHEALGARCVVEGANLSLTPDAEHALARRGVTVVPDLVANCGTNAWWWWTLFGDIAPTTEASLQRIATVIPDLVEAVLTDADRDGGTTRRSAVRLAEQNMALLDAGAGAGAAPRP